jgi:hypothetical protein
LEKKLKIKEPLVTVILKILKESQVFMKEPAKNWWFFHWFFDFLKNRGYIPTLIYTWVEESVGIYPPSI